jgi:hypothetical protein
MAGACGTVGCAADHVTYESPTELHQCIAAERRYLVVPVDPQGGRKCRQRSQLGCMLLWPLRACHSVQAARQPRGWHCQHHLSSAPAPVWSCSIGDEGQRPRWLKCLAVQGYPGGHMYCVCGLRNHHYGHYT